MKPKLSIIIPVRDGVDFIGRAIASAQGIPVSALEIVVIDDGSSDGTAEVLHSLAAADPRIVVITRDRDHGVSAARNEGIAKARADLICFLDADDELRPDPIAVRVAWHVSHPETVLSFANHETVLPDGVIEHQSPAYYPRFAKFIAGKKGMIDLGASGFGLMLGENPVCTTGTMARRSTLLALSGFARELRQAEDWDLWIRASRQGKIAYSTCVEVEHAAREGSLSSNVDERTNHISKVVFRHWRSALRQDPLAALCALSFLQIAYAEQARLAHHNIKACIHYFGGFVLCPSWLRTRDFARSVAVLMGLRSDRIESLDERARIATTRCLKG